MFILIKTCVKLSLLEVKCDLGIYYNKTKTRHRDKLCLISCQQGSSSLRMEYVMPHFNSGGDQQIVK